METSLELVSNAIAIKMRRTQVTAVMPSAEVASQYTNQDQVQKNNMQFTSGAVEEFGDFVSLPKMVWRTHPREVTYSIWEPPTCTHSLWQGIHLLYIYYE